MLGTTEGKEQALNYYKQASDLNPDNADALNNIAYTYKKMGNAGMAKAYYLKAAAKGSENAKEWCKFNNVDYNNLQQAKTYDNPALQKEIESKKKQTENIQSSFPKPAKIIPYKPAIIPNGGSVTVSCITFNFSADREEDCMFSVNNIWEHHKYNQTISVTNNSNKGKHVDDGSGMSLITEKGGIATNLHFSFDLKPGETKIRSLVDCIWAEEIKSIGFNSGFFVRNLQGGDEEDEGCAATPKKDKIQNCGNKFDPSGNGWKFSRGQGKGSWESKREGNVLYITRHNIYGKGYGTSVYELNLGANCISLGSEVNKYKSPAGEDVYVFTICQSGKCKSGSPNGDIKYFDTRYLEDGSVYKRLGEGTTPVATTTNHVNCFGLETSCESKADADELFCHLKRLFNK